jgi:hypothetical protein
MFWPLALSFRCVQHDIWRIQVTLSYFVLLLCVYNSLFIRKFQTLKSKCPFVLNIQLAKLAGNKVVATCGGESKSTFLTSLGVDRVINYRSEKIKDVSFCSSLSYLSFILQLFIMQSLLFVFQMFKLDNISFGSFMC